MALALVQTAGNWNSPATTVTATFSAGATAGNLLVAALGSDTANASDIVTPAGWTLATSGNNASQASAAKIVYKIATGGETTVSCTISTSARNVQVEVAEFSGFTTWVLDKTPAVTSSGASSVSTLAAGTTGTLSSTSEVVFGAVALHGTASGAFESWDNSFTPIVHSGTVVLMAGYRLVSATTSLTPSASWNTSRTANGMLATFQQGSVNVDSDLTLNWGEQGQVDSDVTLKWGESGQVNTDLILKWAEDGPLTTGWKVTPQAAWDTDPLTRPDDADWTTLTEGLKSLTIKRGTKILSAGIETGTATATFDNSTNRNLDPNYTGSAYYPNVVPRRRLRYVLQDAQGNTIKTLHTGFTESYQVSWALESAQVTIPTQDLFGILGGANLPTSTLEIAYRDAGAAMYLPMTEDTTKGAASDIIGTKSGTYIGPVQGGAPVVPADSRNVPSFMRSSSVVVPDAALVVDPFTPAHAFTFVVWFRWNISNTSDLSNPGLLMLEDSSPPNIPGGNATSPKLMIPYLTPTTTFPGRHAIACQIQDGSHCVRLTAPVASQILDGNYHMIAWQVDGTAKQVKVYFDGVGWGLADTGESGTTAISSIDVNSVIDAMAMFAVGWGPDWQSAATNPTGAAIGHTAYFPSVLASGDLDNIWDAGTLCWDGDTTDERLDRVCDQIGIDPDDRDFDTGTQTCGPTVLTSQNALSYLKKINATEAGECFVNGDGKIRFRSRPSDTAPVAIFTDLPEGGGLQGGYPCEAVTPQNDWTRIVNTVEVGIESGASQVVTDTGSAATYGPLSGSVGGKIDTLHQDLGDARATAQFRIDGHKNPTVYIPQIRVSSVDQAVPVSALVGIEVGDFVGVIARPPSPTDEPIQVLAQVEYVQYDFPNPTELVTTYSLGDGIPALFLDVG